MIPNLRAPGPRVPIELAPVRGLTPNTEQSYNGHIREFNRWNAGSPITEERIRAYFLHFEARLAPATLRARKSALRLALERTLPGMHDTRLLAALETTFDRIRIARPRESLVERDILSAGEVAELIRALPEPVGRIAQALYSSGFRISELLSIRVRDCRSVGSGWISVRVLGKGRKEREIPAWRAAFHRAILHSSGATEDEHYLFQHGPSGRAFSRQYVWRIVRRVALATLERSVHPHIFRHSHATALLAAGVPLDAVARRLGHSDPGTTARYYAHTQIRADQLEAAVPTFTRRPRRT